MSEKEYLQLVLPAWISVWSFLKSPGIEPPYELVIEPLGIYPKELKSVYYSSTCMPMLIAVQSQ